MKLLKKEMEKSKSDQFKKKRILYILDQGMRLNGNKY
jgi:hypothetical protein